MNNLKAQGILWVDDKDQRHYSLKFQGIVYHLFYNVISEMDIDLGEVLTQIMYCDINENEEYEKGNVCLIEEFQPKEVIEEYEFKALYLRRSQISESVCGISKC